MVFEVDNLPHPQAGHTGFQCITNIEDAKMLVPARVESNRYIVCEKRIVSKPIVYSRRAQEMQ